MGSESWFGNLRRNSWRGTPHTDKEVIGVLAFEVASLMSKVAHLWHFLSDHEIHRVKKEILNSVGIRKVVADDDQYVMDLALNEIMENFGLISRSVARLGRRCIDPLFRRFENFVYDPLKHNLEWMGWDYRLKKMDRKVKKMERFIAVTMQLSQELEVLAELEQTLRRMRANPDLSRGRLLEFRQKVLWQRQEVRNLREMSPWTRTYDYTVRLLVRSLLTILQRIKHVFEISQLSPAEENCDTEHMNPTCLSRSCSYSVLMQSSIHPSGNILCRFSSDSNSGIVTEKNKVKNKQRQLQHQSFILHRKPHHMRTNQFAHIGPFKECMFSGNKSPILQSCDPAVFCSEEFSGNHTKSVNKMEKLNMRYPSHCNGIYSKLAQFSSKQGLLNAPSSTLGHAALALRFANVIVLVEKLASSPHMVDYETRDDLYNMLTSTIRAALRTRLKAYGKSLGPSAYDAFFAAEWSLALTRILEWLSPLAHNMIRWHSERNFEEREVSRTNVLLVQTLHYANHGKTEAAITELLVGLNYICRINGYPNDNGRPETLCCKDKYNYVQKLDNIFNRVYNGTDTQYSHVSDLITRR